MLILFQSFKQELQILTMNERTFYWNSPKELAQKVIKLDKIERRKFFQSLEMHDVPMGALMGFTKIQFQRQEVSTVYPTRQTDPAHGKGAMYVQWVQDALGM